MGTWMEGVIYDKPRANGDNIVGCYTLSPLVHPVFLLLRIVGSSFAMFETGQTFSPVQTDSTLLAKICASVCT